VLHFQCVHYSALKHSGVTCVNDGSYSLPAAHSVDLSTYKGAVIPAYITYGTVPVYHTAIISTVMLIVVLLICMYQNLRVITFHFYLQKYKVVLLNLAHPVERNFFTDLNRIITCLLNDCGPLFRNANDSQERSCNCRCHGD